LKEVPVRWDNDAESKISLASDSFKMVGQVLSIRERARRGQYEAAISAVRALAHNEGP
jgi:hypothetical protein